MTTAVCSMYCLYNQIPLCWCNQLWCWIVLSGLMCTNHLKPLFVVVDLFVLQAKLVCNLPHLQRMLECQLRWYWPCEIDKCRFMQESLTTSNRISNSHIWRVTNFCCLDVQDVNFLVSVSLKAGKVFALFVKAPSKVCLQLASAGSFQNKLPANVQI